MRAFQRMKLKTRAALIVGVILLVALGTVTTVHVRGLTRNLQAALQVKALLLAQELTSEIVKILDLGLDLEDIDDLAQRCRDLVEKNTDLAYTMVVDREGKILHHNDESRVGETVTSAILTPGDEPHEYRQRIYSGDGEDVYTTLVPLIDNRGAWRGAVVVGLKGEVIAAPVGRQVRVSLLAGAVSFAAALALIILFVSTRVSRPLSRLAAISAAVGEGDLTRAITTESRDEIGELYGAFNAMLASLRELQGRVAASFPELEQAIGHVTEVSGALQERTGMQSRSVEEIAAFMGQVNEETGKITSQTQNLSKTAEETSSSIMEMMASIEQVAQSSENLSTSVTQTSSSMEEVLFSNKEVAGNVDSLNDLISRTTSAVTEIDASVKQVEEMSRESNQVSEEVKKNAQEKGSKAVEETIGEMTKIREAVVQLSATVETLGTSVNNIGEILNVIDDVAEQTNLLALNAAIIAAQAGEHGRGFAVVADEIRELAERTSSSTKEIAKVITGIQTETKNVSSLVKGGVERVDKGVEAVERTDETLRRIIASTERAAEISARIAHTTSEQSASSRMVSEAIQEVSTKSEQISRATAEQTRGSETIVEAIENMREMAEQVRRATVEQSTGARLIAKAGEQSAGLSQDVANSTRSAKELTARAVQETDTIRASTQENLTVVEEMNRMVEKFGDLAGHLKKTLSHFRT